MSSDLFPIKNPYKSYFSDVDTDSWYSHYVNAASAAGFISTPADNNFRPNDPITRADGIQVLMNARPDLYTNMLKEDPKVKNKWNFI